MDRVGSTPESSRAAGFMIPALLLIAVMLVAGCGPKKVIKTDPTAPKTVVAIPDQAQDFLLPLPQIKGKSGRAPVKQVVGQEPTPDSIAKGKSTPPGSTSLGLKAAALAKKQLGKQYQWGAEGPDKFDCSGLTLFVYKSVGVQLPRNSRSQAKVGKLVTRKELQPGDLLFFAISGKTINHVGIYVGGSKFIHAPRKYNPVRTDSLNNSWWRQRLISARRMG